jgi:hypothetical protein
MRERNPLQRMRFERRFAAGFVLALLLLLAVLNLLSGKAPAIPDKAPALNAPAEGSPQ